MNFKTPVELAEGACLAAETKSRRTVAQLLLLGTLAGAYIAFGGFFMLIVTQDLAGFAGVGVSRLMGGGAFSLGLMLVVVAGGELFTGNCMMPMGTLAGCAPLGKVLRNWLWVYAANALGSLVVLFLLHRAGLLRGAVAANALKIAVAKTNLTVGEAFCRGILCNWLVVLAVWMSMAATDIAGKLLAILFPITAFVASGFEHCVANFFLIPAGLLAAGEGAEALLSPSGLSLGGLFRNLVPVTAGNIVGGVLFVAVAYFFVFRDRLQRPDGP